jgi:ubiquitin-conjugating enzyme E2 J2
VHISRKAMASGQAVTRLRKEYQRIQKEPAPFVEACPLEENILEWHYVITGPPDSVYAGGFYHGKIKFPNEYPYKPPSILMVTPSGRFRPNTRLCLTMSDFHPESWNPLWSVSSILSGLLSFMLENTATVGSIDTSDDTKRSFAAKSLAFNLKDPIFVTLFPHMRDIHDKQQAERAVPANAMTTPVSQSVHPAID